MTRHNGLALFTKLLCAAALFAVGCRAGSPTVVSKDPSVEGIVVDAEGEARGAPDMARIEMGVQARAGDAATATREVAKQMQDVLAALKAKGIPAEDIQTRNLSIHEERHWEPPPRPEPMGEPGAEAAPPEGATTFVAQNIVSVTVRDLDALPSVLGAATDAGVNQMHGITLELEDPTALEAKARDLAFEKARAKAEHLARLSGAELGELVSMQLGGGQGGPHPMAMSAMRDSAESMPVQPGEITIRQHIQLRYALKK